MNLKSNILKILKNYIIVDLIFIAIIFFIKNWNWILNSQIAFASSIFITIATFYSYQANVKKRLEGYGEVNIVNNDQDEIDKIEDPYDLYSEDNITEEKELTTEKIKEIIGEEKAKLKKNTVKNTIFSAGGFLSIYRILGYAFLLFGFFYLVNNGLFNALAFVIGLTIVPITSLGTKLFTKF